VAEDENLVVKLDETNGRHVQSIIIEVMSHVRHISMLYAALHALSYQAAKLNYHRNISHQALKIYSYQSQTQSSIAGW
jgi:hypothetical protein